METPYFKKLRDAVEESTRQLSSFRAAEARAFRQYVGQHYGENGSAEAMPVNMMEMGVSTLLQQLAAKEPQVLLLSTDTAFRSELAEAELAINEQLLKMDFGEEMRLFVLSAIFSVGIMKVGKDAGYIGEIEGEEFVDTEVFAEHVPFSDWVHDTTAKRWRPSAVQFCGNKYRAPLSWILKNRDFDSQARDELDQMGDSHDTNAFDKSEDEASGESIENMSHSEGGLRDSADFVKQVDLWDIWVPGESEIITYAASGTRPLKSRRIQLRAGSSPYHMLGFNPVIKNVMPLAPVSNWMDAHDLENKLFVKLGMQASRQKTITLVNMAGRDDGDKIIEAQDGDVLTVNNPQAANEVRFGGPDQQTLGFAGYMRDMISYIMYNLDATAGLGASADTASQEKIIKGSSNVRLQSLQGLVVKALRGIIRDILGHLWESPLAEFNLTQNIEIPNQETIQHSFTWPIQRDEFGVEFDAREGVDLNLWKVDIEPHSLQEKPPGQRVQEIRDIWRNEILPAAQYGVQGDIEKYLKLLAKYMDLPEIVDLASFMPDAEQSGGGRESRPAHTEHESTRTNITSPGMSRQGAERQMMTMAMAGGSPGQQAG